MHNTCLLYLIFYRKKRFLNPKNDNQPGIKFKQTKKGDNTRFLNVVAINVHQVSLTQSEIPVSKTLGYSKKRVEGLSSSTLTNSRRAVHQRIKKYEILPKGIEQPKKRMVDISPLPDVAMKKMKKFPKRTAPGKLTFKTNVAEGESFGLTP